MLPSQFKMAAIRWPSWKINGHLGSCGRYIYSVFGMVSGLKIASNWSPWATKNRPGRIEIMTQEPIFFFFFFFFF